MAYGTEIEPHEHILVTLENEMGSETGCEICSKQIITYHLMLIMKGKMSYRELFNRLNTFDRIVFDKMRKEAERR